MYQYAEPEVPDEWKDTLGGVIWTWRDRTQNRHIRHWSYALPLLVMRPLGMLHCSDES